MACTFCSYHKSTTLGCPASWFIITITFHQESPLPLILTCTSQIHDTLSQHSSVVVTVSLVVLQPQPRSGTVLYLMSIPSLPRRVKELRTLLPSLSILKSRPSSSFDRFMIHRHKIRFFFCNPRLVRQGSGMPPAASRSRLVA